jgi:hypothetical protein
MLPIIGSILDIANKFVPDTNKQAELKAEIVKGYESGLKAAVNADKEIRMAELRKGGLAASWRPIAACSIFFTLFLHWFIFPLVRMVIVVGDYNVYYPQLDALPIEYYGLALSFVSIYAYGRSREKEAFNLRIGRDNG